MTSMNETERQDNRQVILREANRLVERVEQAYEQGEAVHELERGLFAQLLRMGHQLLELFFELCGAGDRGAQLELDEGRRVKRLERRHGRAYCSVFGEHQLERVVYGTREGQKIAYVPLDSQLQLPASQFSYLRQEWDQALAVEQSYAQVRETLERMLGIRQSVPSLERINQQLSGSVDAFWSAREPAPVAQGEEMVVGSADGKGVVMRRGAVTEVAANAATGAEAAAAEAEPGGKKMALIGAVYTIEPYIRTPEQVLKALFEPSPLTEAKPPPRPKPLNNYVRASLARDAQDTMAPSYADIFLWLAQEQRQRNPTGQHPVVVLMDGQKSLWTRAELAFAEVAHVEVLDLLHALGYLWDAAELFYPSLSHGPCSADVKQQRLVFVKHQTEGLLNGQVQTVMRRLCVRMDTLNTTQRQTLDDIVGYFRNNASRMQYDQYLQAGYPIASGVIEGACRHIVCDRMERSGMRWLMPGAKAMLALRCISINQEWEAFMAFHIARENQRLYPGCAANDDRFLPDQLIA